MSSSSSSSSNGAPSQNKFLQLVNEANFDEQEPVPNDGEACQDLFAINSSRKSAGHLTTGCLHVFADDVLSVKQPFAFVHRASAVTEPRKASSKSKGKRTPEPQPVDEGAQEPIGTRGGGGRVAKKAHLLSDGGHVSE